MLLIVGGLLFCLIFYRLLKRTAACKGKKAGRVRAPIETVLVNKNDAPYEVKDLHAPLARGKLFQFLIWFTYTPLGRFLITKPSLKRSNGDLMAGEYIPEAPKFDPVPAPQEDYSKNDDTNAQVLESLCSSPLPSVDHFRYNTIMDYHHAYKTKLYTPTDVIKETLNAIKKFNKATPPLMAIVEWNDSVVMAMAEASTDRWGRGEPLSYLDGVPVAVKDEIMVEPYQLMGGARFRSAPSENITDGELVHRLKESGAVLIGMANMQEFGTGTLGSNPNKGTPRNPHNPAHYCGGSSSGSAASVASGLCPLAIGADGGGSVRIPASLCGVSGLKPTSGLLDTSGTIHLAYTVHVAGPLASSSLDIAIAMDILLKGKGTPFNMSGLGEGSLSGLKIGLYPSFFEHAEKSVVVSCQAAVEVLKKLGAEVKEIVIPELEETRTAHLCLIASEMYNNFAKDIDEHFNDFNLETLLLLAIASEYTAKDYINSLKQRARSIRIMEDVFEEVDLIVTPCTSIPAPKIHPADLSHGVGDANTSGKLLRFMFLANITGVPGISIPVGMNKDGLPLGLQLMAPWYQDGLLTKVGHALEGKIGPIIPRPKIYFDALKQ